MEFYNYIIRVNSYAYTFYNTIIKYQYIPLNVVIIYNV